VSARTEVELARKEDLVGRSLAGSSTGGTDAGVELPRPQAGPMSSGDSWLRLRGDRPEPSARAGFLELDLDPLGEFVDGDQQVRVAPGCLLQRADKVQTPHSKRPGDGYRL
jgi:hypothetical protein